MALSATLLHGSAMGVERRDVMLETHIRITQSCRSIIVLVSLHIQRLHKLYLPGSCSLNVTLANSIQQPTHKNY